MRVAHGDHGHLQCGPPRKRQRPQVAATDAARHQASGVEGQAGRIEPRLVHVDGHTAVGLQAQLEQVVDRLDAHRAQVGQPVLAHIAHEAAGPIAAMLDLGSRGAVEDAVAEVDIRPCGPLDDEDLVGTDAEAPVTQALQLRRS
jgi:hypothetical protein